MAEIGISLGPLKHKDDNSIHWQTIVLNLYLSDLYCCYNYVSEKNEIISSREKVTMSSKFSLI